DAAVMLAFPRPGQRAGHLRDPDPLVQRCRALPRTKAPAVVVLDEAQNVPAIFDAVQHLYDSDTARWRFVLCGSSARKLRVTGANLLPGRSMLYRIYPLVVPERPFPEAGPAKERDSPLPLPSSRVKEPRLPPTDLVTRLTFGELPGIAEAPRRARAALLSACCLEYLEGVRP